MKHEEIIDSTANSYGAHIYFQSFSSEEGYAQDIAGHLEAVFGEAVEVEYPRDTLYCRPHPSSHIDIRVRPSDVPRVLQFFEENHADLSVVVHPQTGHERRDLGRNAVTIGRPVVFDFAA